MKRYELTNEEWKQTKSLPSPKNVYDCIHVVALLSKIPLMECNVLGDKAYEALQEFGGVSNTDLVLYDQIYLNERHISSRERKQGL